MSWRPEEYAELKESINRKLNRLQFTPFEDQLIEAGATVMLEALRECPDGDKKYFWVAGVYTPLNLMQYLCGHGNYTYGNCAFGCKIPSDKKFGKWVFISDDESTYPLICGSCGTRHSPEEACPPRSQP